MTRFRAFLARMRALLSRLAFWRARQTVALARAIAPAKRELPKLQVGEFLVRIPSVPTGYRTVYHGRAGKDARDVFTKWVAMGRSPEFYDAPGGLTRRRA